MPNEPVKSSMSSRAKDKHPGSRTARSESRDGSKRDSGRSKYSSSKRRDSDEKSAKSRERRSGASTPGATYERSSESRASGKSKTSRSDRDSKSRSRRSGERASKPGATYERSSGGSRQSKKKDKQSRSGQKDSRLGAHVSNEKDGDSRATRKERRETERRLAAKPEEDITETEMCMSSFDSSSISLTAMAVDDNQNDKLKELEEKNARIQRQLEEISSASNPGGATTQASTSDAKEDQQTPSSKKKWVIMVALLVLVGGGVGAYFGTRHTSSSRDVALLPTAFGPPSQEDCEAIANQLPISGQEDMPDQTVLVNLDANPDLAFTNLSSDEFADYVEDAVESSIVPELVGCVASTRKLIRSPVLVLNSRVLQDETEYIIRNVAVDAASAVDKGCEDGTDTSCKRIVVTLVVTVRDSDVRKPDVLGRIKDSFDVESLVGKLRLETVFNGIQFVGFGSDTTSSIDVSPSKAPTEAPTESPTTGSPTFAPFPGSTPPPTPSPTVPPTLAPVVGPTPPPTSSPTSPPTILSTPRPTSAPSAGPTIAPVVGPSPPPTARPTPEPTREPSPFPTQSPTPRPTPGPTPLPTPYPTPGPTPLPTTASPTPYPTPGPTPFPTTAPPTPYPTPGPTPFPSTTPYSPPPTLLPNGATCLWDSECQSSHCGGDLSCSDMKEWGEVCFEHDDCTTGRCATEAPLFRCRDKLYSGQGCVVDGDCWSNSCTGWFSWTCD